MAIDRYLPGSLLKKGLRVRITRTTKEAEITDSRNHAVLNCSGVAWRTNKSTAKVRKSNTELKIPKVIIKLRMKWMSQRPRTLNHFPVYRIRRNGHLRKVGH